MTHQRGDHAQFLCSLRPERLEAERLRRENDGLWWLRAFIILVGAARYAQFFSGTFLFPAHAGSPQSQFIASHTHSPSFTLIQIKAQKLRCPFAILRNYSEECAREAKFYKPLSRGGAWQQS